MSRQNYLFTSESVSEGHPDKICDRISDAILDAFLTEEEMARVACETFATTNRVVIGGEVGLSTSEKLTTFIDGVEDIVRECVKDIGYEQDGFHWKHMSVENHLHPQSAHIAQGVDNDGAGDQGIMFGYACTETPELMPAPIQYSHAILRRLADARHAGDVPQLGPDAKSQLSVQYVDGQPVGVTSIVLSTQHLDDSLSSADVQAVVEPYIRQTLPEGWISADTEWHVNPTGKFVIGGPDGKLYFNQGNCGAKITDRSNRTFYVGSFYYNKGGAQVGWNLNPTTFAGNQSDDGHVWVSGFTGRINLDGTGMEIVGHGYRNSYEQIFTSFGDMFQNDNDDPPACRTSFVPEGAFFGF